MSGKRQQIQYVLALEPVERGETPLGGSQGTEPLVAKPAPESPAVTEQLMEEVCTHPREFPEQPRARRTRQGANPTGSPLLPWSLSSGRAQARTRGRMTATSTF